MSVGQEPAFSISHQAWAAVRSIQLSDRATVRRLQGGAGEIWWVELAVGGGLAIRGVAAECTVTVIEGRLACHTFGNEVELPDGHVALLPPNLPFTLRVSGRSRAVCLIHCNARLADPLPIEPA